jgi:hypothetical protein
MVAIPYSELLLKDKNYYLFSALIPSQNLLSFLDAFP